MGKMAVKKGRHFIGVEKVPEYFELSKRRIMEGIPYEEIEELIK